jgi:hypothetical protein
VTDDEFKATVLRTLAAHGAMLDAIASGGPIASEADIFDKYGDPVVGFDPKTWRGQSYKGKRFSECPPEYLDHLAAALQGIAAKEEREGAMFNGKPSAPFTLRKSGLARRWSIYLRANGPKPGVDAPNQFAGKGEKVPNPFEKKAAPAAPVAPVAIETDEFDTTADELVPFDDQF